MTSKLSVATTNNHKFQFNNDYVYISCGIIEDEYSTRETKL